MPRRRTCAVVVALSLLAACGSDAADPAPEAGSVGTTTDGTTDATTTTAGATTSTSDADSAEASDAPTASDGSEPTGGGTTTSDGTSGTSGAATGGQGAATGGATGGQAQPAGPGVPAGTYRYDVDGSTSVGTFPPQNFTAVLTTVADASSAEGRQRIVTTTEFTEGSSPRSLDEERTLVHTTDDIRLARLVTDGNDDPIEFVLDPPAIFSFVRPAPGQTWEWTMTSTDGRTTAKTVVTARGSENVTVGSAQVEARVADATVTFTGEDFEGTQDLAIWFDPSTRLILRQEASLEGRARVGGAWFDIAADDTRLLRSLQPA